MKKLKRHTEIVYGITISFFILFMLGMSSCQENSLQEIEIEDSTNTKSEDSDFNDIYWGEEYFYRSKGKPEVVKKIIGSEALNNFEECFMLIVKNGDGEQFKTSSAVIKIDGEEIVSPSDFSQNVSEIQKELCSISIDSYIEVEVRSKPGSYLSICIKGKLKYPITGDILVDTSTGIFKIEENGEASYLFQGNYVEVSGTSIYTRDYSNIKEYNIDGDLIREIPIPSSIPAPSEPDYYMNFNVLPNDGFAFLSNEYDKVYFMNNNGVFITEVEMPNVTPGGDSHLQNVHGVVIDNKLVISENGNKQIFSVDLDDYSVEIYKDLSNLSSWLSCIDYYNNITYVCKSNEIYSFSEDEDPMLVTTFSNSTANIAGIVCFYNYAFVSLGSRIIKVNLTDGTQQDFSSNLDGPQDIELY